MEPTIISRLNKPDEATINAFREELTGILLLPGDDGYDEARKIWNGMIDRRPAFIARCINVQDVIQAVNFARKHQLLVSVKSGGHNVSGNAVNDDGLMIDLSLMRSVTVNAVSQTADVETGATWGDFDTATQQHGLASTGGLISTTGVAGLTLGGGVGWLVRKHGMACDNLIEADIVTADGRLLTASIEENTELFWGIRGGGGNFGVVTRMKFQLHKLGMVVGGMIIHPRSEAKAALQFFREFMKTAPETLTLYTALLHSQDGLPVVAFMGCYSGDPEQAERVLKPLFEFGTPIANLMQPMPYTTLQTMLDAPFPHGNRYYWKSGFLRELSDEAIDTIIAHGETVTSPLTPIILEMYGGAASREPQGGTSYPHRQTEFDLVIISNWVNSEEDHKHITWTRNFFEAMQSFTSNKVYVNLLGVEGQDRVREAYGENYNRLLDLKDAYDPINLFSMNQNITRNTK